MNRNLDLTDLVIRWVITITIGVLYFSELLEGEIIYVLLALGLYLGVTASINYCPLYKWLRINTAGVTKMDSIEDDLE